MRIGYARVSTPEQDLTPQLDALREGKPLASGMSIREIAPAIGVSVPTLYRHFPAPVQDAISAEREGPRAGFAP